MPRHLLWKDKRVVRTTTKPIDPKQDSQICTVKNYAINYNYVKLQNLSQANI